MKSIAIVFMIFLTITGFLSSESLLIDDFSNGNGQALIGGSWQGFTDRVMGGLSNINAGLVQEEDFILMRMEGQLSLENNGGFIQLRLPFDAENLSIDLSSYKGLKITYRENKSGDYAVHIRTRSNRRPWAYFSASIDKGMDSDGFQETFIPWNSFSGNSTSTLEIPLKEISSLAIVAVKTPGPISIDIKSIELY